jgi:DNA-binding NarL/FixJ family response regulator
MIWSAPWLKPCGKLSGKNIFCRPKLVSHLVYNLEHSERHAVAEGGQDDLSCLTDREMEVFQWLSRGHGTKQIAETLNLGVKTIETHRANIMSRLGLRTSEALMAYARSWRLRVMKVA